MPSNRTTNAPGGHNFMDYSDDPKVTPGVVIAQQVYSLRQAYDRLPNVRFTVNKVLGIKLTDALNPSFNGLDDPDYVPQLSPQAKKVTIRVHWPGYHPWDHVVPVVDHTYDANPNTRKKLACIVAQRLRAFLTESRNTETSGDVDQAWSLKYFNLEDLVLLELRHVSAGSWQPVLLSLRQ